MIKNYVSGIINFEVMLHSQYFYNKFYAKKLLLVGKKIILVFGPN